MSEVLCVKNHKSFCNIKNFFSSLSCFLLNPRTTLLVGGANFFHFEVY